MSTWEKMKQEDEERRTAKSGGSTSKSSGGTSNAVSGSTWEKMQADSAAETQRRTAIAQNANQRLQAYQSARRGTTRRDFTVGGGVGKDTATGRIYKAGKTGRKVFDREGYGDDYGYFDASTYSAMLRELGRQDLGLSKDAINLSRLGERLDKGDSGAVAGYNARVTAMNDAVAGREADYQSYLRYLQDREGFYSEEAARQRRQENQTAYQAAVSAGTDQTARAIRNYRSALTAAGISSGQLEGTLQSLRDNQRIAEQYAGRLRTDATILSEYEAERTRQRRASVDVEAEQGALDTLQTDLTTLQSQAEQLSAELTASGEYDPQYGEKQARLSELNRRIKALSGEYDARSNELELTRSQQWFDAFEAKYDPAQFTAVAPVDETETDFTYRLVNQLNQTEGSYTGSYTGLGGTRNRSFAYVTSEERNVFNTLWQRDQEEAREYLDGLTYTLNQRRVDSENRQLTDALHRGGTLQQAATGALLSAASVPANLVSGIGALDIAIQRFASDLSGEYRPVDYNTGWNDAYQFSTTVRSDISQRLNEASGMLEGPLFGSEGWGAGTVYETVMSVADSLAGAAVFGSGTAALLGSTVATSAMQDAHNRGASDTQAVTFGLLSGTFETLFEYASLDHLLNNTVKGNLPETIMGILAQSGVEASEELCTTVANTLISEPVLGNLSSYRQAVQEYLDLGYEESAARKQAAMDLTSDALSDAMAGMLSGLLSGGGQTLSSTVHDSLSGSALREQSIQFDELIQAAQTLRSTPETAEAAAQAREFAGKMEEGTYPKNDANLSRLVRMYEAAGGSVSELGALSTPREVSRSAEAVPEAAAETAPVADTPTAQSAPTASREAQRRAREGRNLSSVLGASGARAFTSVYNTSMAEHLDEVTAFRGYAYAYNAELKGMELSDEARRAVAAIPESLRVAAEGAAQMDAARASQASYFGKEAGLVRDKPFRQMHLSSQTARTLDAVAKAAGVKVLFEDAITDGETGKQANAKYEKGVITIARNTENPVRAAMTHEVIHRIREVAPAAYQSLASFVQANLGADSFAALRQSYGRAYQTNDASYLSEEIVADAFGVMLGDSAALSGFARENRSAAQRLLDGVRDLIAKVRRVLTGKEVKLTAEDRAAFRDLEKHLTEMAHTLETALKETQTAVREQNTRKKENTATQGGEVSAARYSFNDKKTPDYLGLVAILSENLNELKKMDVVASVRGNEVPLEGRASERAYRYTQTFGNQVLRDGLGSVVFSKAKLKSSMVGHGIGEIKIQLMAAVPNVISQGRQLIYEEDWKGRGYSSFVFAAPVEFQGEVVYLAVIVTRDSANRYYLHEAVDQAGNIIYGARKPGTASDRLADKSAPDTVASSELSSDSIPQTKEESKPKFSLQSSDEARREAARVRGYSALNRTYSYDELVAKKPLVLHEAAYGAGLTREEAIDAGIKSAKAHAARRDTNNAPMVFVEDLGKYVTVGRRALGHVLDRRAKSQVESIANIGTILSGAFVLNEADPTKPNQKNVFYLIGGYESKVFGRVYVRMTVNQSNSQLEDIASLYATYAKKEEIPALSQRTLSETSVPGISEVSIAKVLEEIKDKFSDVMSDDVIRHLDIERARAKATDYLRFSLQSSTEARREAARLQRENESLRERVAYWRGQTRRTTSITADPDSVRRTARELLRAYNAGLSVDEVAGDLQDLYGYIMNNGGSDDLTFTEVRRRAEGIARTIVEHSTGEEGEFQGIARELMDSLWGYRITLTEEESRAIPEYNDWRKRYFGVLRVSRGERSNIDQVYQELSYAYPEFFNEEQVSAPVDQLLHIAQVVDQLRNADLSVSMDSLDAEAAVSGLAGEIIEGFFEVPQARQTFADRQAAKLDQAKADIRQKENEKRRRMRAEHEDQMRRLRERNRERLAQVRQQKDQKYRALAERNRERNAERKERQSARELRAKITRHAQRLSQRLLKPTDTRHIPEGLRGAVAALLDGINQESVFTVDPATGKRTKNGTGDPTKRTEAFLALREQYAGILRDENTSMVVDPALEELLNQVIALRGVRMADMNTDQLQTIWNAVKAVEASITSAGRSLAGQRYARIDQWAGAMSDTAAHRKGKKVLTRDHVSLDLETPVTFFSHFGEAGNAVYRMLRDAQDKQQRLIDQVTAATKRIVDRKTMDALQREVHPFTTRQGEALALNTAQCMELMELMRRDQATEHLAQGGIVQPEVRGKTADGKRVRLERGTRAIHLEAEDLAQIVGVLTEEQVQIADRLQGLMSGMLADMGNEASMQAYGYRKFTEEHYWPIKSAREQTHRETGKDGSQTRAIKNMGSAKQTQAGANNALDLSGIFDTFAAHVNDMTTYAAYLCPMEDATRLFNYQFTAADEEGARRWTGWTVSGLLDYLGGKGSQDYWGKLMDDLQNGIAPKADSLMAQRANRIIGNAKGAAVGANLRVILQQPTAFLRANAVLDPRDLAAGILGPVVKGKGGWKRALQYSPVAMRKEQGGFEIGNTRQMKEVVFDDRTKLARFNDAMAWGAGKADAITWGRLWNACEHQVAREHQELTPGSEGFYEEVNRVFTAMIDQTQVVDGALQRSQIMRSGNALAKMATAFMGEPTMSLNLLMRTWDAYAYETDNKRRGRALQNLGRAAVALLVTDLVNAVAQSIVDAWRDDDEDKKYQERFLSALTGYDPDSEKAWDRMMGVILGGNIADNVNPLGRIPFAKDLLSLLQGFKVTRADADVIQKIVQAVQTLATSFGPDGSKTRAYALKELVNQISRMFGVSAGNILRDTYGVGHAIAVEADSVSGIFFMDSMIYSVGASGNKNRYMDLLYKAISMGDSGGYDTVRSALLEAGYTEETIRKALEDRITKAFQAGELDMDTALDYLARYASEPSEDPEEEANDAYFALRRTEERLAYEAEHGDADGFSYSRYDGVLNAVQSGNGFDAALRDMLDHGYTEDDVRREIRSSIGEWYQDGPEGQPRISKEQALSWLQEYGGISREDAEKKVNQWSSYVVTGIRYNEIEDAYLGGEITASRAAEMLRLYGGYSTEEAQSKVTVYELHKQYPDFDGELSESAVASFLEVAEPVGISLDQFYDAVEFGRNTHADVDENGEAISGSKKEKILAYINGLNLTGSQKDALYFYYGYAESKLGETPWH